MTEVFLTGCNRGIGLELTRQFLARGATVHATCRTSSDELEALASKSPNLRVYDGIDVRDADALGRVAKDLPTLDMLVCNAGILRPTSLEKLDLEELRAQFDVNAIGPLLTVAKLCEAGRLQRGSKVGLITSMMGSMSDNGSGGAYGYRMSKAALNAAGVSLARDLASEGIAVALLHPGYVRTDMTRGHGNIDVTESAEGLLARLDALDLETSAGFWHTNGSRIGW